MITTGEGAHFVFVHGASHGGWCWYKVRCFLERSGHTVTCIDLKSAGIDPTDPNTVFKFDDYNQPLLAFLSSLSDDHKVILVGHSVGGFNVTQALHKFPTKLQAVVYLAAAMAKNGVAPAPVNPTSDPNHAKVAILKDVMVTASSISPDKFDWVYGLGANNPPTSMIMKKEFQREMYYSMSPLEDCTLAGMLLRPFPVGAMMDGVFPDGEGYEKVPRVFIKTLHDRMMSQESQDAQIEGWPPAAVFNIDSEHSAFFSNPVDLFALLLKVASQFVFIKPDPMPVPPLKSASLVKPWTRCNPGRRFWAYVDYDGATKRRHVCKLFKWYDGGIIRWQRDVCNELPGDKKKGLKENVIQLGNKFKRALIKMCDCVGG